VRYSDSISCPSDVDLDDFNIPLLPPTIWTPREVRTRSDGREGGGVLPRVRAADIALLMIGRNRTL
jgi:hypothetical protein